MTRAATPVTSATSATETHSDGKGLARGTLGLVGSTVIGLACTAPVHSIAATIGFVVIAVGAQAPIAMILAFIPMFLTAFAYRELNRAVPDCGTAFIWGTKAFEPWIGWMAGWGVAVAGTIVLANIAEVGSSYFWQLFNNPDLFENQLLVVGTGALFVALMTFVSVHGIQTFYVGMKLVSDNILHDTILSIGLAIAFYYSIVSFACIWYFRRTLFCSVRNFFIRGVLPLLGGLMLVWAFIQSAVDMFATDYGATVLLGVGGVFVIGIGSLALGVVIM